MASTVGYKSNAEAILGLCGQHFQEHPCTSVLDLGCGDGSFLHQFQQMLGQRFELYGLDESAELLRAGRSRFAHITFIRGDLRNAPELLRENRYDAVFLLGTHSIFDDVRSWLDAVVGVTVPGGAAFILGLFNPEPFDTILTWRRQEDVRWITGGYNCWSQHTVARRLGELQCAHAFDKVTFDTSFIDSLDETYPMTFRRTSLEDGTVHLVNGLQLFCNYYLLTIRPDASSRDRCMRGRRAMLLRCRMRAVTRRILQSRYLRL